jgi:hypothetical protein
MSNDGKIARSERALAMTDEMTPGLRECVHEYGFAIVNACRMAGVTRPAMIHLLVREIWEGARQPRQRRANMNTLDWLLVQAKAEVTSAELIRVLRNNDLVIVPICPTTAMINASMKEVSGFTERVTKCEKHRRRLTAAIKAAAKDQEGKS